MNTNGELYLGSYIEYDAAGRATFIVQYYEKGNSYKNAKYTYECNYDMLGNETLVNQYHAGELIKSVRREYY